MSSNSTGNSTMNKSASPAKRVAKKSDAPASSTATPATATAPVSVADKATKKTKPTVAPTATTTPVTTDAPTATPVATEAPAVEVRTVEQEIASLIASHQKMRDEASSAIKTLQRLQKRVAKEVKEAGRRRRRAKREGEDGVTKEKRPTIFTTPVTLKDELCHFLGKSKGSQMTPADVTRAFSAYVDSHKLKDAEKGHTIHPDAAMRKVLGVKEGETVTYRNIQSYLYKLYVLPEKKKPATS
jgi:chromatin remodeling complex protein RSC6